MHPDASVFPTKRKTGKRHTMQTVFVGIFQLFYSWCLRSFWIWENLQAPSGRLAKVKDVRTTLACCLGQIERHRPGFDNWRGWNTKIPKAETKLQIGCWCTCRRTQNVDVEVHVTNGRFGGYQSIWRVKYVMTIILITTTTFNTTSISISIIIVVIIMASS